MVLTWPDKKDGCFKNNPSLNLMMETIEKDLIKKETSQPEGNLADDSNRYLS